MLVLTQIASVILGIALLVSGSSKLAAIGAFASALEGSYQLPHRWIPLVSRSVPALEITSGTLILFPSTWLAGAILSTGMLMIVTAAAIGAVLQGRTSDCGCFGVLLPQNLSWWVVARASALLALAILLIAVASRDPNMMTLVEPFEQLLLSAAILVLFALLVGTSWLLWSVRRGIEEV